MIGKSRWRWASRLLWIAITLNILFVARFAVLMEVCNLIGYQDNESVLQFNNWNWMEYAFLMDMLMAVQLPELLCLVVLCGCLIVVKLLDHRAVQI